MISGLFTLVLYLNYYLLELFLFDTQIFFQLLKPIQSVFDFIPEIKHLVSVHEADISWSAMCEKKNLFFSRNEATENNRL